MRYFIIINDYLCARSSVDRAMASGAMRTGSTPVGRAIIKLLYSGTLLKGFPLLIHFLGFFISEYSINSILIIGFAFGKLEGFWWVI